MVERLHHEIGSLDGLPAVGAPTALQHPGKIVHGHCVAKARGSSVEGDGGGLRPSATRFPSRKEGGGHHAEGVAEIGCPLVPDRGSPGDVEFDALA